VLLPTNVCLIYVTWYFLKKCTGLLAYQKMHSSIIRTKRLQLLVFGQKLKQSVIRLPSPRQNDAYQNGIFSGIELYISSLQKLISYVHILTSITALNQHSLQRPSTNIYLLLRNHQLHKIIHDYFKLVPHITLISTAERDHLNMSCRLNHILNLIVMIYLSLTSYCVI